MFSSQSAELSLDTPCRAVASVPADRMDNRFLVGSSQVRGDDDGDNKLFACRFHADVNELGIDAIFAHPTGPVQSIACSPSDITLVATSSQLKDNATLWKLSHDAMNDTKGMRYDPEENTDTLGTAPKASMEALTTLSSESGKPVSHISWRQPPHEADSIGSATSGDLLTVDQMGHVQIWDVEAEKAVSTRTAKNSQQHLSATNLHIPPRVAWDPHAGSDAAAVTMGQGRVRIFDWRADQSIPVGTVDHFTAHRSASVIDMDYNPNKPYVLATSGTDGLIRFWDLRSAKQPILVCRGGHSHWVWNVQYNPFHDQLVLSTGTDTVVNLWRISSISSAPLLDSEPSANADKKVASFEHSDACYASSWGAADAWVYATVGYQGKVMLHHVPSKEKYKILL